MSARDESAVPVGPEPQADPVAAGRRLDLLALMDERAASVVSPVLAAVLDEAELLRARVAELETAPKTAWRASHDSIVMGLYTTEAEARKHCEAEERRSWSKGTNPTLDWIEDDEDGVAEMTAWVGGEECETGYVVTPLEVASKYDPEADQ